MKQLLQYYLQNFDKECSKTNLFLVANLQKQTKKCLIIQLNMHLVVNFFAIRI